MPFTNKAMRAEIHNWINKDGSKVGRITSETPLALNMHLVEVVWQGIQKRVSKPTIIYVCNTTLEAELLDRQLKDKSFHGGKIGEQSVVSKGMEPLDRVVLLSYARFRQILDAEAQAPSLPCRLVVICEQEPGSNMDAVIARGQFALLARSSLVRRAGHNVKLLGLSYRQGGGQDWLRHAVHVMSTSPLRLSLDLNVSYGPLQPVPEPEQFDIGKETIQACVTSAVETLSKGKHVVVYASPSNLDHLDELARIAAGPELRIYDSVSYLGRDFGLDAEAEAALGPVADGQGTLMLLVPGLFSTPLPFVGVGMVISLATNFPRKVYDNRLRVVASSHRGQSWCSLVSQRLTGWGRDGRAAGGMPRLIEAFAVGDDRYVHESEVHMREGTRDPLRECFAMAAAYPGTALNLLPIFAAVDEPRDLPVRLRIMGLLVNQDDGFILTEKGRKAEHFMRLSEDLTLEAATALAGIDVGRMGHKVARSILRLALVRDLSRLFVGSCSMELQGGAEFEPFVRTFAKACQFGGPGRELIDRGLIWLTWVAFESTTYAMATTGGNMANIIKPGPNCPLFCMTQDLRAVMGTVRQWEDFFKLGPINDTQRGNWDDPLSPAEVAIVEEEIARANYSTLLDIPIAVKGQRKEEAKGLPICWLRTKRPVALRGEFDEYLYAARRSLVGGIHPPPQRQYVFFGALPMEVSTDQSGNTSVTGLMWLQYDLIKKLMGDMGSEDADPLLREVMRRQ